MVVKLKRAYVEASPDDVTRAARAARIESFRRLLASRLGSGEPDNREPARP